VLVLIAGVAGVAVLSSGEEATAGEIFLDPRNGTQVGNFNPFTKPSIDPSVVVPKTLATNPDAVPLPTPIGGAIPTTSGNEPGLYGGTRDSSVCDPTKLVSFLQENADKAKAWANTLGVGVSDISNYVSSLTSVLLRADTRVTNHGFENGKATAVQSVLEERARHGSGPLGTQRESALAKVVAQARESRVAAQFLIWEGDPGSVVIEAAEAEGADVIIVGSHDRGPVGRLLLGSVSSYVVDHSRRPVVVIRPGQRLADVWPVVASAGGTIVAPRAAHPSV